jgi:hypothetical protein
MVCHTKLLAAAAAAVASVTAFSRCVSLFLVWMCTSCNKFGVCACCMYYVDCQLRIYTINHIAVLPPAPAPSCTAAVHAELLKQAAFLTSQRVLAADGSLIKETQLSQGRQEFEQQGLR